MRSALRSSRLVPLAAFAVAAACAFMLSGCHSNQPAPESGLAPVRLQLDWYPQPEQGGVFAAQLLGYYKAEGLDVTNLPLPQYGSVGQLGASGQTGFLWLRSRQPCNTIPRLSWFTRTRRFTTSKILKARPLPQ